MYADTTKLNGPQPDTDEDTGALTLLEFTRIFREMEEQPTWRARADKEMEYVDGNQLSTDVVQRQREIGMPPAIEPVIGPAIESVCGLEAKSRADWRVMPDGDGGDEVAKALNYKLNQAERHSKADQACSDAYRSQVSVGVGWVEVSRNPNPFQFPYRCKAIHRNEIWWDMLDGVDPDLSNARWLVRRLWTAGSQVKLMFPGKKSIVGQVCSGWANYAEGLGTLEGGASTELTGAWLSERGWSVEEQQWRDTTHKRACLFEVWYRRWERIMVLKTPDGRVVEFNKRNPVHAQLVAIGATVPESAVVPKMRRSYWLGPHCLDDGPTPYRHQKFPYVPFWGNREDRTGVPYGLVRGMIYLQDNINAMNSRLRWGVSAVRTTRTKGAVEGTDAAFRRQVARVDADIILSREHMAEPGAEFKVERDFALNEQHWKMLQDARAGIARVSNITPSFQGSGGGANSGVQEATQVEQSTQGLANINDNFAVSRAEVGDLLLALLVEDLIGKEETVTVKDNPLREPQTIRLNAPAIDEGTGIDYLDNDVERTKLKVALNDVPSTSSYRSQQLSAMSESFKAAPPELQRVLTPYLTALMDLPSDMREDIIKEVREAGRQVPPAEMEKQVQQRIAQAVDEARMKDARDLRLAELDRRFPPELIEAQLRKIVAETFKINVEGLYSGGQTAATIAMNPALAPVTDIVVQAAGYQAPNPVGVDPNLDATAPVSAGGAIDVSGTPGVRENTSPALPPVPQQPPSPMQGIETSSLADNVQLT
ncbi:hypothetical protein J2W32_004456 [Variovorax boronicumulans]|uniref:Portal protein n=1 Tax=Variovorax boronicumulans TaxID=436515 RepID=A0AAW8D3N4_9BURK|nr:hypothetical protein [Variovorax boronicumulans]MDP9895358.1 hypothetical protein [Variovorax boronicumulans]MDQ0055398.1 hypothetical protein [Variovorax boronicumulans]